MASPAMAFSQLATECETEGLTPKNAERIGSELAKMFNVRPDEVGILRLEKQNLVFAYPSKLHSVGSIPLNTVGSVAVRTANTKRAEVFNGFAQTKHVSIFEAVELGVKKPMGASANERPAHVIQKLMSVPVVGQNGTLGVIEICRKGPSAPAAGPDFSAVELQKLVTIASSLAKCFK